MHLDSIYLDREDSRSERRVALREAANASSEMLDISVDLSLADAPQPVDGPSNHHVFSRNWSIYLVDVDAQMIVMESLSRVAQGVMRRGS